MIIWQADGKGFIYLENCKRFYISKVTDSEYVIFADEIKLGSVKAEEDADRVLMEIAKGFTTGKVDVDPW